MSDYELESLFKKDTELIYDKAYVNKVFKRLERVCNASLYIASKLKDSEKDKKDFIKENVERTIVGIIDISSETLVGDIHAYKGHIAPLSGLLMKLVTFVTLGATTDRIPSSHAALLEHEVNTALSELAEFGRKYSEVKPLRGSAASRLSRVAIDAQGDGATVLPEGAFRKPLPQSVSNRKDRVRAILQEKGQVGIKDISDTIKDVSEKSIQRDLNDMIESGEIIRIGERRWSTYKLS